MQPSDGAGIEFIRALKHRQISPTDLQTQIPTHYRFPKKARYEAIDTIAAVPLIRPRGPRITASQATRTVNLQACIGISSSQF
jgi:hypothetical protein